MSLFTYLRLLSLTPHNSRYTDHRTRHDRTENQTAHWDIQIGHLVDAYLDYRSRSAENGMPTFNEPLMVPSSSDTQCLSLSNIELVDLFRMYDGLRPAINANLFSEQSRSSPQSLLSHKYPNETLIYHGYIGCAPMYPTVAISLRTLAAYRQIHRTCPRFSIQAQCKALCFLHDVSAWLIW